METIIGTILLGCFLLYFGVGTIVMFIITPISMLLSALDNKEVRK